MPDLVPDWFHKKREMLDETVSLADVVFMDNQIESKHGSYAFVSVPFSFCENTWLYHFCAVASDNHDKTIDFVRDGPHFPYAWVKKHPKRRKYLVCGEDRQSISVVDLNSWKLHTWLDETDDFKPKKFFPSPDGKIIAVLGSTLGELDSIRFYDFSDPIRFPWKLYSTFEGIFIHEENKHFIGYIVGWDSKENFIRVVSEDEIDENNTMLTQFIIYADGDYEFDVQEKVSNSDIY
jgi:hypothetical protein